MKSSSDDGFITALCLGFLALVLLGGIGVGWYRAGVQAEVYRREGIELSQWEVFMGARPAERSINIKQGERH